MEYITVTINNWKRFNPRKDVTRPSWFRLDHSIFFDPDFEDFSGEEIAVWVYLLSMASYKNSETVRHKLSTIYVKSRVKQSSAVNAISKLEQLHIIAVSDTSTLRGSYVDGKIRTSTENTEITENTEKTERLDSAKPIAPVSEFFLVDASMESIFSTRSVTQELQQSWLRAYPEPDWIVREIHKAIAWENSNPKRRKKDFGRFMTNWLNRSWDSRRIPAANNRAEQVTEQNRSLYEKIKRGDL